ncbi:uncharacterized protein LOC115217083 [Argonauta hians]
MVKVRWRPCIMLHLQSAKRTIHMYFTHAPERLNVSSYIVALVPYKNPGTEEEMETNQTTIKFTGVRPANYTVLVKRPRSDPNENCQPCTRTYTKPFQLSKTNHTSRIIKGKHCGNDTALHSIFETIQSSPGTVKQHINSLPIILITCLIFIIFFAIIFWFMAKYRRRSYNSRSSTVLHEDFQAETENKEKKKVYIINTFDHDAHQNACESFMVYLQEHCFCEVLNLKQVQDRMLTNLASIIKSTSFIIIIHSEGYSKQVNAWKKRVVYPELCKSNPSLLFQVIDQMMTNSVDCAMSYTNPVYFLPKDNSKNVFIIPDHMTELVCHLHDINLDNTDQENIPLIKEHIYSSSDGIEMTKAIDRATEFEILHDDWFIRLHPNSFSV